MEHVMKRFLSMLIAVVMVVSMLPTSAFASTEETTSAEPTQTVTGSQPTDATEAVEPTETTEAATQPTEAPVAPVALDHQPEDCPNGGHCAGCCDGNHDPAEWTELTASTPIEDGGKYYLTGNISMQIQLGADKGITVCLNGHTITGPAGQRAFWLSAGGASLTIYDCSKVDENGVSEGVIVGGDNSTNTGSSYGGAAIGMGNGVTTVHFYNGTISGGNFAKGGGNVGIASGSVFNMYGGLITGGVSGQNGGNVFVYNGTFNMYSGTIQNGNAQNGGGVYVTQGTFNMYGGTIKNCSADVTGGGISLKTTGSVNLTKDTKNTVPGAAAPLIDNCTATAKSTGRGGNVYMNSGTFTMDHGTIQNGQNLKYGGGNVFIEKSSSTNGGTFIMNNGTIKDGTGAGAGGNIRITAGTFTMNGGTISGGTCKGHGGSISVGNAETSLVLKGGTITAGKGSDETDSDTIDCNGLLTINGTKITGDVRVYDGKTITVGENGLGAGSAVTLMSDKTDDSIVMTSNIATDEAAATFKSMVSSKDTETYCVSIANDYQICLIKHDEETVPGYAAECEKAGLTNGTKCSNCGKTLTEQEEIPALNHNPGTAVKENEVDATCTATGSYDEVVYCTVCDAELSRNTVTVEKLAHNPGEVVKENEVDATCTATGSYDNVTYCTVCDAELSRNTVTVDALGHDWDEGVVTKQPDCDDEGVKTFTCQNDPTHTYKEAVNALGHNHGTAVKENEVDATCTATGSYDEVVYCTVCNAELSRNTVTVEKLAHNPGEVVKENEVDATCTATGSYDNVTYCTVCDAELSRNTVTVDKLDHTAGGKTVENNVAATCEKGGSYDVAVYCTVCKVELSRETTTVDALGHSIQPVKEVAPTVTAEGYKAHYKCVTCGTLFSDAEGENEIEAPVAIPKLIVDAVIPEDAENKEAVTTIMNSSTKIHEVINLPEDHYLEIKVTASVVTGNVVTKVTYDVTPYSAGVAVNTLSGKITFHLPVDKYVTKQVAAVFHGDELMGADFEIKVDANGEKYVEVESDTFSLYTVDTEYEEPAVTYVAQIGDTKYESLEAAFAAAVEGDTIVLLTDAAPVLTSQRMITKAAVVDLGNNTMTLTEDDLYFGTTTFKNGTIVVDSSVKPSTAVFWMFADQTLTFDNVKLVATGVTGTYLIGLDGNNADLNIINGSEIVVENETALDLDIICVNASTGNDILVSDSKVTVTNLDGRVFFRGNYTISGNSDIDLSGITKAGFRIEAGQTLTIEDTATVDIVGEPRDGGIHLTDATATYTKADTATVNATINKPITAVAEVDGTEYETLQAAVDAADGKTVTLLDNIVLEDGVVIAAGKTVTIDLNGKTVSMADASGAGASAVQNNGTLTVKDSVGGGKITFASTTPSSSYGYSTSTIINAGNLTIDGGIIENTTVGGASYAIDNSWYSQDVSLTINDGTITANKIAVRQVPFSTTYKNVVTVNGGTLTGATAGLQVHNYASSATLSQVNITGGTFNGSYAFYTSYTSAQISANTDINISGGTFNGYLFLYNGNNGSDQYPMDVEIEGGTFNDGVYIYTKDADGAQQNIPSIAGGSFTTDVSDLCVDGYEAVYDEATGKYGIEEASLEGTGTEADPFQINDLDDLLLFRDMVNTYTSDGSNQFKGKFVKLTADIDLAGMNWTPIGTNSVGDHAAFLGTFDGDGHTISNLYINADGGHLGFFARVGSYAEDVTPTVKNLKFHNVDVSTNVTNHWTTNHGDYVGGVIANAGGNSVISNITVTGDVYIVGCGYVGGIVGHGYPDIDNCHVNAEDGSYLHCGYWCGGGIIGYAGEGGTPITNCSVSGLDIWTAYGAGGGIAGMLQDNNKVDNVTVSNVEITSDSDYCMGYVAGNGECSTMTNITVENVTATAKGNTITATDAVASVDGAVYFDLQAAVDAADGKTVTLLRNVALADTLKIAAGTAVTLDLNGKTISQTKACAASYEMISNNGTLTIDDSVGGGKISFTDTGAGDPNAGWGVYTIRNAGTLVVNAGTIENLSAQNQAGQAFAHTALAIFQYSGSTTINGGVISTPNYRSVRLWSGDMTIKGGKFSGQVWVQCVNDTSKLTIEGGEFAPCWNDASSVFVNNNYDDKAYVAELSVTGGSFATKIGANDATTLNGSLICGGTFTEAAKNGTNSALIAEGFVFEQNADGSYGVEKAPVAEVNGVSYKTIEEAIANWTAGTTLTLLADVTLSDVITLNSTEHHILNLGTYTMTAADGKNAFVIKACGTGSAERSALTINADATNPGGINAGKKCVVYYKYADGGISTEDRPIIKINGGVFTGSTSSFGSAGIYTIGTAARKCATVNIAGGTFNCSIVGSSKSKLIVSGGTFNYTVSSQGDSTCSRLISGGKFKTIGFMTADSNNTKFWIGTSMGNSNVGVHVDDDGYIVVGGPVVTEAGETFEASSANYGGASSYLQYSSAKDNGLYYTSVEEAFADNNKASGEVTVYVDELDMTGSTYKGSILVPEGKALTITFAEGTTPTWNVAAATDSDVAVYTETVVDGVVTRVYETITPVAQIGETYYETVAEAMAAAQPGDTVTLLADVTVNAEIPTIKTNAGQAYTAVKVEAGITLDGAGHTLTVTGADDHNWSSAVYMTGGTVKDLTIVGGKRGVLVNVPTEDITLDGVSVSNSLYALNTNSKGVNGPVKLTVSNSTFNGWTSISNASISAATFENCQFGLSDRGEGNTNYAYFRPYCATTISGANTTFSEGYMIDGNNATTTIAADVPATEVAKLTVEVDTIMDANEDGTYTVRKANYVAQVGEAKYESLAEAFANAQPGDTVELLSDITVTDQIKVIDNALLANITFNGNGHTITADLDQENESVLYFGNTATSSWATGVTVKNVTIDGTARFAIALMGGTTSTLENVTITGDYLYGMNLYGTHGATMTNCDVVSVFTNGSDDYPLTLVNSTIGHLYANKSDITEGAKVFIDGTSAVKELTFWGESTVMIDPASFEKIEKVNATLVAEVNGVRYTNLAAAIAAAGEGDTVTLLADVTTSEIIEINEAITLDLNGNKVTSTAKKAFEVYADATICNGTIEGANRCVDTRKAVELTLTDVTLIADEYTSAFSNPQPLTIGGSENGTKVTMTNVNISAEDGYGIITFVETELTATNSTVGGYSALYVKPGSENSTFTFVNSALSGSTANNDVEGNSFSTIAVRADNVTVNTDADTTVSADGNYCCIISLGGSSEEGITGANVTVAGTINGNILYAKKLDGNTVTVKADYADELTAEGFVVENAATAGMINVAAEAEASFNGVNYVSLSAALMDAYSAGGKITLLTDCELTDMIASVPAGVTLDLNGNTLKVNNIWAFGQIVDGTKGGEGLLIANGNVILDENNAFLPLYDAAAGGYRVYSYGLRARAVRTSGSGVSLTFKYYFAIDFTNADAYLLLGDTANSGVEVIVDLKWTDMPTAKTITYTVSSTTVASFAREAYIDLTEEGKERTTNTITISVTGLQGLAAGTDVIATMNIYTDTSVVSAGAAQTGTIGG